MSSISSILVKKLRSSLRNRGSIKTGGIIPPVSYKLYFAIEFDRNASTSSIFVKAPLHRLTPLGSLYPVVFLSLLFFPFKTLVPLALLSLSEIGEITNGYLRPFWWQGYTFRGGRG